MTGRIPKRLQQEPLIEAIWQVQFEPAPDQALGDVLPGVLFSALRPQHADLKIHRLPVAEIPAQVAALDPNLRFAVKYRIEAPSWPYLFQVGDRVITLNCRRPYVGWDAFKTQTLELIAILESSGLIPAPRRHSLRYIDLLALETPPALASLRLGLDIGEHHIDQHPLQMRVELPDAGCLHVLQIVTPAQVTLPDGAKHGTLIDLETLTDLSQPGWDEVRGGLDALHTASKALFFGQLLTGQAIERMGPEYAGSEP
jgi:uncharacterized protein (TIGR04255 family)